MAGRKRNRRDEEGDTQSGMVEGKGVNESGSDIKRIKRDPTPEEITIYPPSFYTEYDPDSRPTFPISFERGRSSQALTPDYWVKEKAESTSYPSSPITPDISDQYSYRSPLTNSSPLSSLITSTPPMNRNRLRRSSSDGEIERSMYVYNEDWEDDSDGDIIIGKSPYPTPLPTRSLPKLCGLDIEDTISHGSNDQPQLDSSTNTDNSLKTFTTGASSSSISRNSPFIMTPTSSGSNNAFNEVIMHSEVDSIFRTPSPHNSALKAPRKPTKSYIPKDQDSRSKVYDTAFSHLPRLFTEIQEKDTDIIKEDGDIDYFTDDEMIIDDND